VGDHLSASLCLSFSPASRTASSGALISAERRAPRGKQRYSVKAILPKSLAPGAAGQVKVKVKGKHWQR
jgi:hypothetical protein